MLIFLGITALLIAAFDFSVIYTVQKDNQEAGLMAIIGGSNGGCINYWGSILYWRTFFSGH